MRRLICVIITIVIINPVLLTFSESDSLLPNIIGVCYMFALFILSTYTKVGRILYHWLKENINN